MISDEHAYEAKVWLRSYADAIECLKYECSNSYFVQI